MRRIPGSSAASVMGLIVNAEIRGASRSIVKLREVLVLILLAKSLQRILHVCAPAVILDTGNVVCVAFIVVVFIPLIELSRRSVQFVVISRLSYVLNVKLSVVWDVLNVCPGVESRMVGGLPSLMERVVVLMRVLLVLSLIAQVIVYVPFCIVGIKLKEYAVL